MNGLAKKFPGCHIALIGINRDDVRRCMIEGQSGIMACAHPEAMPKWKRRKEGFLVWPNGSQAYAFDSEHPGDFCGPQYHFAWGDNFAEWKNIHETWHCVELGLRLGRKPRALLTTTPRPLQILRDLSADPYVSVTRDYTFQNANNLPERILRKLRKLVGTDLGRQELEGVILDMTTATKTNDTKSEDTPIE